ncbi:hypothetical protein Pan110_19340 [Gimesia panareensis]|nr:hypothetical protein Pan110_19340 [Gimesia panareensis]
MYCIASLINDSLKEKERSRNGQPVVYRGGGKVFCGSNVPL